MRRSNGRGDRRRTRGRVASAAAAVADEAGSATLEVVAAGVLLLLPVVAFIVVLATIQAGLFAAQAAATQAARIVALGGPGGVAAAEAAVAIALDDHGLAHAPVELEILCAPATAPCPSRGGAVTAAVAIAVPLPSIPGIPGAAPPSVTVEAAATRPVSRFAVTP